MPLRLRTRSSLVACVLLLALAAGSRIPIPARLTPVAGPEPLRRTVVGPAPVLVENGGEREGLEREVRVRWLDSRHRAAPGVDWRAIEAANLEANLNRVALRRGAQPVWRERGPVNQTGATAFTAVAPDGKTLLLATSQGGSSAARRVPRAGNATPTASAASSAASR